MAKTLMLILSLLAFLLLSMHLETAVSFEDEENEDGEYVVDSVFANMSGVRRSRFLTSIIKKGTSCDAKKKPQTICNGVSANKGTSLLYCCKKHCRNVLGDRNNCGQCGHKCRFGQRCCGGVCTNVLYNNANCGKCKKRCRPGVKCGYGYCGYA